jgi:hypothetical protein
MTLLYMYIYTWLHAYTSTHIGINIRTNVRSVGGQGVEVDNVDM